MWVFLSFGGQNRRHGPFCQGTFCLFGSTVVVDNTNIDSTLPSFPRETLCLFGLSISPKGHGTSREDLNDWNILSNYWPFVGWPARENGVHKMVFLPGLATKKYIQVHFRRTDLRVEKETARWLRFVLLFDDRWRINRRLELKKKCLSL